jgi:glutathione synthase/RimK-type ligase-like ATP-grasp enzyme
MNLLVTSSRMHFALALIRHLAQAGHRVFASDTFAAAPGSHSKFDAGHFVTAKPRQEPRKFIDDLRRLTVENKIDLIVPSFEEVFVIAKHRAELEQTTKVFCPSYELLAELHDKSRFPGLTARLGLPTAETIIAHDAAELRDAVRRFPHFAARPAFSRGGVTFLSNFGPRAGTLSLDDAHPTPENPWVVQEYLEGDDLCCHGIARDGKLLYHVTYGIPIAVNHAYGAQIQSVEAPAVVEAAERVIQATRYTGQIAFDLKQTARGLYLVECNPRCTNGVLLMDAKAIGNAITQTPPPALQIVPPGRRAQFEFAMIQAMIDGVVSVPRGLHELLKVQEVYLDPHDIVPALYAFISFHRFKQLAAREHVSVFDRLQDDIVWNGEPIA